MKLICYHNETATVELNGVEKDLPAHRIVRYDASEEIVAFGIALKYRTGKKVWSGSATFNPETGKLKRIEGPLDHHQRFASLAVLGFYADTAAAHRSQHNGN